MSNTRYHCVFLLGRLTKETYLPSIAWAQSGFWVDRHYQFTNTLAAHIWIPPARILYIELRKDGQ